MTIVRILAALSLSVGAVCALWVALDERSRQQRMWIMVPVWPLVALSGGPLALWLYRRAQRDDEKPFWLAAATATCHCGAGCTLGDLGAEMLAVAFPAVLVPFGLGWATDRPMFAAWGLDFVFAYLIGIVVQYFTIAPMRKLGLRDGIVAALKADTLSLIGWQVGMYGAMAAIQFLVFVPLFGHTQSASTVQFWFAMQIAMIAGFATSYPINILLLRFGLKERM